MEQRRKKKRRKRRRNQIRKLILLLSAVVILTAVAALIVGGLRLLRKPDETIYITIADEDFTRMSEEEALSRLMDKYPWNLSVRYNGEVYSVDNLIEEELQRVVEQVYREKDRITSEREGRGFWDKRGARTSKEPPVSLQYEINIPEVEDELKELASALSEQWGVEAKDAEITGFDTATGKFVYSQPENGYEIDADALSAALCQAVENGDYEAEITAVANSVAPSVTSSDYKLMGTYKTTATNNASRNTNIRIASQTIDGMVLAPGEQFSFNGVLGRRTEEKGYKEAGAYANGESVQEYGGGVCQVSSTIYNAVIAAGLQADVRTGHTFEPSYVTPGQDATVSYDQPDFAFTNTTDYSIGLRTIFENPVVRVEIYGVPVLEEGAKRYMQSEKTGEVDPPAPEYIEDPTVPFGQEVISRNAVNGSVWKTNIITEKNGEIVDTTYLHSTQYKGKNAVIRRNTTNPAVIAVPQVPVPEAPAAAPVEVPAE